MADEGITFMDAHSSSAVCTPTRYGVLTGRYNWRSRLARGVFQEPVII
jgi:arylsulfatase A